MKFEGSFITTGGQLFVNAKEITNGEVLVVCIDDTGSFNKTFFDKYDFKKWLKSLHIFQTKSISELCR